MSREFKLKFDQLHESDPTGNRDSGQDKEAENEFYPGSSNTRNICFLWPDDRKIFLNYSYLVSGEYQPQDGAIVLGFTSHLITIKGHNLEKLFTELMLQSIKSILCIDPRYVPLERETGIVYDIRVEKMNA